MEARDVWTFFLGAIFGLLMGMATTPSHGHDWYPRHCCSETDCHKVAVDELEEQKDGRWKHLPSGVIFEKDRTYPSQDRHWHVCIGDVVNYDGGGNVTIDAGKRPLCVFIQMGF